MTIFTTCEACEKYFIPLNSMVTVPRMAAYTGGTTAYLREGDQLSLLDLMYGLMLPSGNDAANTIANFVGKAILTSPTAFSRRRREN